MRRHTALWTVAGLLACSVLRAEPVRRFALLVGINDYSASLLPGRKGPPAPQREISNLDGAVNDVEVMRGLLIARYGFREEDIVTLLDQQATADAIRGAIEGHLVAPAQ